MRIDQRQVTEILDQRDVLDVRVRAWARQVDEQGMQGRRDDELTQRGHTHMLITHN